MSDVTIPEAVREAADKALNAAWDEHAELFSPHSNTISDGLWKRLVEHSARAILAGREAERERCAKVCEDQKIGFLSPEYSFNQPLGSLTERFACDECAQAIRSSHE